MRRAGLDGKEIPIALASASRFRKAAAISVVALIALAVLVSNGAPLIGPSIAAKTPKEHVTIRIYFPNCTTVYLEWEAELRVIGRNELGTIWEAIPESVRIIKQEVYTSPQCSCPFVGSSSPLVIVRGFALFSGLPARPWQYRQVPFGYTFSAAPNVAIGETLAEGQNGHIEDPNNRDWGSGVTTTYFWFCSYTTGSGTMATHFIAAGG